MPKYILGLDIGGTKIQSGLVNNSLTVIQSNQSLIKKRTKQQVLESIFCAIEEYPLQDIKSMGISITGMVDQAKGIVIRSPNLPKDFHRVSLKKIIQHKFKRPTYIENDANSIALAEAIVGAGKGQKIVFCLTLGTGVGSGLIINKKIYRGAKNIFEFGHTFISNKKQKCSCGQYGHFESFVSGKGLEKTYQQLTKKSLSSYEIIKLAMQGNQIAKKSVQTTSNYLALGLANIINSYNPDIIILGGGLSSIRIITEPAIKNYMQYLSSKYKKTKIITSKLGYDAGILGSALLTRYTK